MTVRVSFLLIICMIAMEIALKTWMEMEFAMQMRFWGVTMPMLAILNRTLPKMTAHAFCPTRVMIALVIA